MSSYQSILFTRGIDVVRNKIKMFAQKKVTLSPGQHKIVILDEADRWVVVDIVTFDLCPSCVFMLLHWHTRTYIYCAWALAFDILFQICFIALGPYIFCLQFIYVILLLLVNSSFICFFCLPVFFLFWWSWHGCLSFTMNKYQHDIRSTASLEAHYGNLFKFHPFCSCMQYIL